MSSSRITLADALADRLQVVQQAALRQITQRAAAAALRLSYRQTKRLVARYRALGPDGIVPSERAVTRRRSSERAARVVQLVRERYIHCGPTLARQYLLEHHDLKVGRETLRKLAREAGIWVPRSSERDEGHITPRKERAGELVHVIGCTRRWFGERGGPCMLLLYIDDATSRLQLMRFVDGKATFDYMQGARLYVERYGKPWAFFDERHASGHCGKQSARLTQYGRALRQLGIEQLAGGTHRSPARFLRNIRSLRRRVIAELGDEGISSIASANVWADSFLKSYNRADSRSAVLPNAHRPLLAMESLEKIFSWRHTRILSGALTLQYDNVLYLLEDNAENRALVGHHLNILEYPDGGVKIQFADRDLVYREFDKQSSGKVRVDRHSRLGVLLGLIGEGRSVIVPRARDPKRNRRYVTRDREAAP